MLNREPTTTRSQTIGSVSREIALILLAFAAGFGGYMGSLKEPPRIPEDYYAAIGAGALLSLAKMIPGGGSGRG